MLYYISIVYKFVLRYWEKISQVLRAFGRRCSDLSVFVEMF